MWTALVLACLSSLLLSGGLVATTQGPEGSSALRPVQHSPITNASRETTKNILHKTSERVTTSSPVTSAKGTLGANHNSSVVTAGRTPRTDVGTAATETGGPNLTASGVPMLLSLMSTRPAPSSLATLSSPHPQAPSSSSPPGTASLMPPATSSQAIATTSASALGPLSTQGPTEHTPSHSAASTRPPVGPQAPNTTTQGSTLQASTAQPLADTSRPTPPLTNTTPEPTPSSVVSVSTTVVTATMAQAEGSAASSVSALVPHTSRTPGVESPSLTIPPGPTQSPLGSTGPGTRPTPEQVLPEATGGTASTGPTPGSSGEPKMPTTDSYQLSTQGQYLVVTTNPLPLTPVNTSVLLAMLLLGVTLFVTVLVLFALQAYESHKKKDYTQVDYLINGMYADSEM